MFTGIIEELGVVTALIRGGRSAKLTVSVSKDLVARAGDSIAVNGACLTVTSLRRNFLEFDLSTETLKRSALGELKVSDKVNLERAVTLAGRLGGHLVTGHIDGLAEIRQKVVRGKEFDLHLSIPSELLKYLVPKGSIAVDGVSLTVADLRNDLLIVTIVPHTGRATTLDERSVGDRVNIEVDLLSKYIERHLRHEMKGIGDETLSRVGYLPMGWIEN